MRWLLLIATIVAALAAATDIAAADCTCRALGRFFDLGQKTCLATPKGPRIATCGMVLNNVSWEFSREPCVAAQFNRRAPHARAAALKPHS